MGTNFEFVRLGDVADFVRGITFKPEDVVSIDEDDVVACMRTKNIQSELDISDVWGLPPRFVRRSDQLLRVGDILVSTANSWNLVGKCCWVPELHWPATLGGFISALRPVGNKADNRYLYRWFSSDQVQKQVRKCARQTTNIANLNIEQCLDLHIPLPEISEQIRVARLLDHIDRLRRSRAEATLLLGDLLRAHFNNIFGDPAHNPKNFPSVSLGELIVDGPTNGLYKPADDYGDGTRILRINNFYDGLVNDQSTLRRLNLSASEIKKYGLRRNDIVINRVNSREYLGKSALIPALDEDTVFESNMMRLRLDERKISPVFCITFMQTSFIRRQISMMAKDAVNQSSINQSDVRSLRILLPPIELQRAFDRYAAINDSINIVQSAHRDKLDQLFVALQQKCFGSVHITQSDAANSIFANTAKRAVS